MIEKYEKYIERQNRKRDTNYDYQRCIDILRGTVQEVKSKGRNKKDRFQQGTPLSN